jgi:hypothetical protein
VICPNCRSEYVEGITHCAECDLDLVESLPVEEPEPFEPAEWVEIYRAAGRINAALIKSLLESSGIPAVLGANALPSVYGFTVGPASEILIYVRKQNVAEAKGLVDAALAGRLSGEN